MGLLDGVAKRFGVNGMSDLNPELVLGLRGIKARTIFVNSGASSGGNGASWDSALTTLVAAQELAVADDVIDNGGELSALRPQVEALHRRYLEMAAVS